MNYYPKLKLLIDKIDELLKTPDLTADTKDELLKTPDLLTGKYALNFFCHDAMGHKV